MTSMKKATVRHLHEWDITLPEAREVQCRLASLVSRENQVVVPRLIAGVDVSYRRQDDSSNAAIVVLEYPGFNIAEVVTRQGRPGFPYIPGLLSFREIPLVLEAWEGLQAGPDLLMVDGQGIAHPRRVGLASHLGVLLDLPAIGCAKSPLCGHSGPVGDEAGSWADIIDKDEVIGAALRTKRNVKPLYVSVGHRVNLQAAIYWTLECCRGYRLPEPTRLAHLASNGKLADAEYRRDVEQ